MESKTCKDMQSQALDIHSTYDHARLFPIEYNSFRTRNDSVSSDSGCNQYRPNSIDDHWLVEGRDFHTKDTIIIMVNPNSALLDSSSEDDEEEYVTEEYSSINNDSIMSYRSQDREDIHLGIKNVDQYFDESNNSEQQTMKHKFPEKETAQFQLPYTSNEYFFITDDKKPSQEHSKVGPELLLPESETNLVDININETDLKLMPNIEDLDRYLIEDMTYTKFSPKSSHNFEVDTKISSNSLFTSIQDVVMKKTPDDIAEIYDKRHLTKCGLPPLGKCDLKFANTTKVKEYDCKVEHGEDIHIPKHRNKPKTIDVLMQTEPIIEGTSLATHRLTQELSKKRNDSDMSLFSDGSPSRRKEIQPLPAIKSREKILKPKEVRPERIVRDIKENRPRSKDQYESKYRCRSRSTSRSCRNRSRSRSQSRCHGRYGTYRRSDSPYKRKRRSRSRSYHKRRSPSVRRDRPTKYKTRSRSPPRPVRSEARFKVPMKKCHPNLISHTAGHKVTNSLSTPQRKPVVPETSDSSSSSSYLSYSSSSNSFSGSSNSQRSGGSYKRDDSSKNNYRRYGSRDSESNSSEGQRRIVYVGKLEKHITRAHLRHLFSKFGAIMEVRLHSKENGFRYGFVTYQYARDAWLAVDAAKTFPQYDVRFGTRRAFCRQSYRDLDGLEVKNTESAYHGAVAVAPVQRNDNMSFEQMLLETKRKINQHKQRED